MLKANEVFASAQNPASWRSPYTFTGKEFDAECGLHYFGARYYLSSLGVWLSTDPLADQFANMSPYAYAANNPALFTDRWGLAPDPPRWWSSLVNGFSRLLNLDNHPEPAVKPTHFRDLPTVEIFGEQKTSSRKGGFLNGFLTGFGDGFSSTMRFMASLGTKQGWKDIGQSSLVLMALGCVHCPQGIIMRDEIAEMTINYVENIPNMSAYEMGYDIGFGTEKLAEGILISRGAGFGVNAARNGLGEAMWQSSALGPRSLLFGRYHSKFVPNGRRGVLNTGMQIGIGWSNHGSRHVFRAKYNGTKFFQIYK